MALQTTGAISLSDIQGEFGGTNPISLDEYYGSATSIPASGPISIGQFYGSSKVVAATGFQTYNFYSSTVPSGIAMYSATPNSAWSSTYGLMTWGNANGTTAPARTTASFNEYFLAQASVWVNNSCSDPSLMIFPVGTNPSWNWGAHASRIALQFNCTGPYLYGTSTSASNGSTAIGNWHTMHMQYTPNSGVKVWVTLGKDDWTSSGTEKMTLTTTANNFGTTAVQVGLGSDYDGYASGDANSTNFSALRISKDVLK